jgi:probable rRNA maturation factor
VHGTLHLIGYDHEKSEKEAKKMETKTNDLLKIL